MTRHLRRHETRNDGSVLAFCVISLVLLLAMTGATLVVVQKSSAQQRFYTNHTALYAHAESGIHLALHDLRYRSYGVDGNLGTASWTEISDFGSDGRAGTGDQGERDGLPTPGEPNVFPIAVGSPLRNERFVTYVADVPEFPGVQRVVSTATDGETIVTIEHYTRREPIPIPIAGAIWASPNIVLDLNGNRFLIDGNDHNVDGSPGPNPPLPGIATNEGAYPGENEDNLLLQIPERSRDQIVGEGDAPSIGEVADFDFDALFGSVKQIATSTLTTGTYTSFDGGDWRSRDFRVTYAEGDVKLSGTASGAGVLVVDGTLTISGSLDFVGLVIVKGDIVIVGGGSGVQITGAAMIDQSFTAVQPTTELKIAGNAEIYYSSEALSAVTASLYGDYGLVYYNEPQAVSTRSSTSDSTSN